MKILPLLLVSGSLLSGGWQASAQSISIAASPTSQSVAPGGSFNVSLTLSVPRGAGPSDVTAFDLYLVTAAANSGYFSLTAANATGPFNAFGPDDSAGDRLATAAATGYVMNNIDQGFSGTTQTVPFTNLQLETVTLSVGMNVPASTYTFQTSTTPTAGVYYTDVSDSGGTVHEVTSPGSFSITVVPEPSTLVFLSLALLGIGVRVAKARPWRSSAFSSDAQSRSSGRSKNRAPGSAPGPSLRSNPVPFSAVGRHRTDPPRGPAGKRFRVA